MDDPKLLVAAIIANPAEDTPRLAFADWLDEHGDRDRARFIRLQYEIEKLPPIGAKTSKAKKEEEALLKKYEKKWAGGIAGLVDYFRFRRGFVELVRLSAASFLKHGERLFELAPIREVRFDPVKDQMPELAASPLLGRAEGIGFSAYIMDQLGTDGRLEALLGSPYLATVRRLEFGMSYLHQRDAERIARCPHLGAVVHLNLSSNFIGPEGLRAVAYSDRLPSLTSLNLWGGSGTGLPGVEMLADSPLADRLEELCLSHIGWFNDLGDPIARSVAGAPRLKKLRVLDLSNNGITDAGAKALAGSPHLGRLERLTLRGHRKTLGPKGRELLRKRFGKDVCVF
jgi:uncharacterized protein (TIGR02996 family)